MTPNEWLFLLAGIAIFDFTVDQALDFLNARNMKANPPKQLEGLYDAHRYAKSQAYHKTKARFGFITSTFSLILALLLLFMGGFGLLDAYLRPYIEQPILLSLVYFGVLFVLADLVNIPFSYYATFVIEERFGFNKTTEKTFVMDKLKSYLLTIVIGALLGYPLLWIISEMGSQFWLLAFVLIGLFMVLTNMFYASVILPLFNKLKPLSDGSLKNAIMEYAKGVHFPLENVYVIDGSKRSTKANAFFSGFGKRKKIVLFDTLIANHTDDQLVAILAHEVGHYKKHHIVWSLFLGLLQMGITLYIMSWVIFDEQLSLALGGEVTSIHLNFIGFGLLYTPISRTTGLLMSMLSRKNEYEADAFAVETFAAKPLQEALKQLSVSSLVNLTPHPLYVFVNYSHPTLLQRIEAMDQLALEMKS